MHIDPIADVLMRQTLVQYTRQVVDGGCQMISHLPCAIEQRMLKRKTESGGFCVYHAAEQKSLLQFNRVLALESRSGILHFKSLPPVARTRQGSEISCLPV